MQHYVRYCLGIEPKYLTQEEVDYINQNWSYSSDKEFELTYYSFTEDYSKKDWGTIIIKDFGDIPNHGKMVSYKEMKKICEKHEHISEEDKVLIAKKLKEYNIEHLLDKVELIIYSRPL